MKFVLFFLLLFNLVYVSLEMRSIKCSIPKFPNGKWKLRRRFLTYTCNLGFILSGNKYSSCLHGKWDSPPPKCVRAGCRKVNPPINGLIYPTHSNAVLHFFCNSGFQLIGPDITHCNGTSWSNNMPICLPTNSKPLLSCDFERADLCGWTHDLNHDFDWRRMQFSTPSGAIGTGPSFDHTYGEDKAGYYMYIESSSRVENDTARLVSPIYGKTYNDTCFQFFYHMYGNTIGYLRVYLKLVNETWNLNPANAFFEKHGNQGDKWIEYVHLFEPITEDYQIIIEGVRGRGYVSDIAIDDVKIIENCVVAEFLEDTSTTTETLDYSTNLAPDDFYSCENNCFTTKVMMGHHRKCACDENCYDRNECCPDFIDFCLSRNTATDTDYTSSTLPFSTSTILNTTLIKTTPIEDFETTEKTTEKTRVTTTTSTTMTTKTTSTTRKFTTEKVEATTGAPEVETTTTSTTSTTTELSNDIPQIPKNMVPIEDVAHLERKLKEKIVVMKRKEESNNVFYYTICGVAIIVITLVTIFLRRRNKFGTKGFRTTSHGDSASDVRFLTSDEILDLNLDY